MILVLFGPQGCGKGTQADLLAEKFKLLHFSMGDALRVESKKDTVLGKKIKSLIDNGILVPTEITNRIFDDLLKKNKNIILDGYPRSTDQLNFLLKKTKIDYAIEIDLFEKDSIKRISSRRMCPECNKNYNLIYLKPKITGKCDNCKVDLVQRDDDKPAEIKKRLDIYKKQTLPLKNTYKKLGILRVVDGSGTIDAVNKKIVSILKNGG